MKKRGIFASVLLLAALFLLLPGCSREAEGRQVDSIKVLQGDGQVGLPGRPFGSELVLELLDVDGYTGGFNLQIAWATGYAAGRYGAKKETEMQK